MKKLKLFLLGCILPVSSAAFFIGSNKPVKTNEDILTVDVDYGWPSATYSKLKLILSIKKRIIRLLKKCKEGK